MAPSSERTSEPGAKGSEVALAIVIPIAAAVILGAVVLLIIFIRRRRRTQNESHYRITAQDKRTHKANASDASIDPLLVNAIRINWDLGEKDHPPPRRPTDETVHDNRDILSDNPAGLYHLPSSQTFIPAASFSPTPSSFCLPHGPDVKTPSDYQHQSTSAERPPLPPLPPLIIPASRSVHSYSRSQNYAAVAEESSISSCSSASSLYSQQTAESPPSSPTVTYLHLPLSQELSQETVPGDGVQRTDTQLVGNLLKARAQRNPDGLVRASSQVSHIERTGSIKSVASIHKDTRPYGRRYRSKKQKVTHNGPMEVVKEALLEDGSLRSRSDSYASQSDYVTVPLPVASIRPALLSKA
ncbi:hypothetical protein P691DRAFT_807873 [Macrolepiota fuliginosa MF-IS2]|uniref:Uncharacterized protein n=1 Tax=Macrolepiota fuliginosa MF-IS2 TaxID=1400762 RepID=A0A9P5X683_9AGAR|nr:hypothetical protein P691DRAFT_807873 [Macrolepiota fuliginosa MF-IS2]